MRALSPDDPRDIGPYRLHAVLGAGGMGRVYLGTSADGILAAVKSVRSEFAMDSGFRAKFARELDLSNRASGPFTPRVLDSDAAAQVPWMATEYVAGPALHSLVRETGALPEKTVRFLLRSIASALGDIHGNGLVHRDLKPGNVMVAAAGPQVIDFGVSRALKEDEDEETLVAGTPGYTAPEQFRGEESSPATDIFSLAGTAVYALTGTGPFGQGHPSAVAYRITHLEPDLSAVPEGLRDLLARCLAKYPADRPTAAQILEELGGPVDRADSARDWLPAQAAARVEETAKEQGEYVVRGGRGPTGPAHRRRLWAFGSGAAALVLAAGAGVWAASEATAPWRTEGDQQQVEPDERARTCARPEDFAVEYTEAARERLTVPGADAYHLDFGAFPELSFVADGELLAVSHPTGVALWDWEARTEVAFVGGSLPTFGGIPTVSPNGCRFAYLSTEGGLHVFDLRTGERTTYLPELVGDFFEYDPLVFSPDGAEITVGKDRTRRIDLESGEITEVWEEPLTWASYSPDGEHLALSRWDYPQSWGDMVVVLETSTGREVFRKEDKTEAKRGSVALLNDEGDLLYLTEDEVVHINYLTGSDPLLYSPNRDPEYLLYDLEEIIAVPGTGQFHLVHVGDFVIREYTTWDLATGEEGPSESVGTWAEESVTNKPAVRSIAAHPAGDVIAILPQVPSSVRIVDAVTRDALVELG